MTAEFSQFMSTFLTENRVALTDDIMRFEALPGTPEISSYSREDLGQIMYAFFAMMTDSLAGRRDTRNLFVETALPGIRDSGVTLKMIMKPTVSLAVKLSTLAIDRIAEAQRAEATTWLADFFGNYADDIVGVWVR